MSVKKAVWLIMKRNGANKDMRLLFSSYAAKRHFAHASQSLRYQRRKMQHACTLNPLVDVWRVCTELTSRVAKINMCCCAACTQMSVGKLRYCEKLRMWTRFVLPLTY